MHCDSLTTYALQLNFRSLPWACGKRKRGSGLSAFDQRGGLVPARSVQLAQAIGGAAWFVGSVCGGRATRSVSYRCHRGAQSMLKPVCLLASASTLSPPVTSEFSGGKSPASVPMNWSLVPRSSVGNSVFQSLFSWMISSSSSRVDRPCPCRWA